MKEKGNAYRIFMSETRRINIEGHFEECVDGTIILK
jgi:hypothetical protein